MEESSKVGHLEEGGKFGGRKFRSLEIWKEKRILGRKEERK